VNCIAPRAASNSPRSSRCPNSSPTGCFALRTLEGPLPIHAPIAFESTKRGTRLQLDAHGPSSGPIRLAQPVIRLTLKPQFASYGAELKRVLEDDLAHGVTAGATRIG
jgi:hypothetical protein